MPKTADGHPELRDAWFERASFTGEALFDHVHFTGDATFQGATFASVARFERAQFAGEAWFNEAIFEKGAFFQGAGFSRAAWMHYARFLGIGATFFSTRFDDYTSFRMTRFAGDANFGDVAFAKEADFSDVVVARMMVLTETSFTVPVLILGIMKQLVCYKAQFSGGVTIRVGGAQVALEQTGLGPLSMLSSLRGAGRTKVLQTQASSIRADESLATARPRLVSLRQTDVADLVLSDIDLRRCRFVEAHHLDKLRIEGPRPFATTPRGWRIGRVGGEGLLVWRWTKRQTLAEEQYWRYKRYQETASKQGWQPTKLKRHGWLQAEWRLPPWLDEPEIPSPDQLAAEYRSLRKAREDSKDEPGAADFYYGEMEMRRIDTVETSSAERFIISLYWLVAGYGLRGSRALGWLLLTAGVSTLLLYQFGFEHSRHPWWPAVLYVAGAITRVMSPPEGTLNEGGQAIRIVLGVLGPVLIGLAALSVRNRIKR